MTIEELTPVVDGYEIIKRLGVGGMSTVHLARRRGALGFEKLVAIKTVRAMIPRKQETAVLHLIDEARLVAKLHHPNIAQVDDLIEGPGGQLHIVMEYIQGLPLDELLEAHHAELTPGIAARIIAEVCRGLHSAHRAVDVDGASMLVVHRDISPQNVMVSNVGRVKILDFGIAFMKERLAPPTDVGMVRGKPSYMAPEQVLGGDVDGRTDVFAASVILYELVTKSTLFPFSGFFDADWVERMEKIAPPSSKVEGLPEGLDEAIMKGLLVNRERRFASAHEMAEALQAVVEKAKAETLEQWAERVLRPSLARLEASSLMSTDEDEPRPPTLVDVDPRQREEPTEPGFVPLDEPSAEPSVEPPEPEPELELEVPKVAAEPTYVLPNRSASRSVQRGSSVPLLVGLFGMALLAGLLAYTMLDRVGDAGEVESPSPAEARPALDPVATERPPTEVDQPPEPSLEELAGLEPVETATQSVEPEAPETRPRPKKRRRARRRKPRKRPDRIKKSNRPKKRVSKTGIVDEW